MSFSDTEFSVEEGRPVRLYEFTHGSAKFRYTSTDRDIPYLGNTYWSRPVSDDGRRRTGEASSEEFVIKMPPNFSLLALFRITPPGQDVEVLVLDMHIGNPAVRVYYRGSIVAIRRPGPEAAEVICQTTTGSLRRPGLRLGWSRSCPHTVYDLGCKANPALFQAPAVVEFRSGTTIAANAWNTADTRFEGGYVEWVRTDGQIDRRTIEAQSGGFFELLGGAEGIAVGTAVTAYPGCPGTRTWCRVFFNNLDNHGGFDLPGKSPFDGNPIY